MQVTRCVVCDIGYAFPDSGFPELGITFVGAPADMPPAMAWEEPLCRVCLGWWHDVTAEIFAKP